MWSRDGAVVAQWWSRSSPTNVVQIQVGWVCCWFSPCSEGFSPDSPAFLPPQKSAVLNCNSIGNSRVTGLSVVWLLCATLVKTKLIYFIFLHFSQSFLAVHKYMYITNTHMSCTASVQTHHWSSNLVQNQAHALRCHNAQHPLMITFIKWTPLQVRPQSSAKLDEH